MTPFRGWVSRLGTGPPDAGIDPEAFLQVKA